jgi:hypothetical protein
MKIVCFKVSERKTISLCVFKGLLFCFAVIKTSVYYHYCHLTCGMRRFSRILNWQSSKEDC